MATISPISSTTTRRRAGTISLKNDQTLWETDHAMAEGVL